MQVHSVARYLDAASSRHPSKVAFSDERRSLTYKQVRSESRRIATALAHAGLFAQPIAVYLDKCVESVTSFFGVACSGNFYTPLDTKMPHARIEKIMGTLRPRAIVTDEDHVEEARQFARDASIVVYEQAQQEEADDQAIDEAIEKVMDGDVAYVLFTSGSTGTPKGVVVSHRALMDFVEWAAEKFCFDQNTSFGSQTPFYFSMSIWDIYVTLRCGGSCHIIPQELFMFPAKLLDHLNERGINTLVWVPSALCLVANMRALEKHRVNGLRAVLFGGEVMPVKQLNRWIEKYPEVRFVNIYGPTEVTDTFMSYTVDRAFEDGESLPLGEPRANHRVLVLDAHDESIGQGGVGELCVAGAGLACGYYNNEQQTEGAFVQNPLNNAYPEIVYRTGDLVRYNSFGELVYVSRKDNQIKHMGHRIELGEVETALVSVEGIDAGCCLYDGSKSCIVAFYTGSKSEDELGVELNKLLPGYMAPGKRVRMNEMPYNLNGKIDRARLKEVLAERKPR